MSGDERKRDGEQAESPRVLRPTERIEDYAVVLAHVRALGGTQAALAALGVAPAEWEHASRWSSAMTREALAGTTPLASAFSVAFADEIKAIAARAAAVERAAEAAAAAAAQEASRRLTVLAVSNSAAADKAPRAPAASPSASPLPRQQPSFVLAKAEAKIPAAPRPRRAPPEADATLPFKVTDGVARPVLPFAARPAKPRDSEAGATRAGDVTEELSQSDFLDELTMDTHDAATTLDATLPTMRVRSATLPFAAAPEEDAPTTRFRPAPPPTEDERAPLPLPLDRYASLCASLVVHARAQGAVLDQFNVAGPEHLATIHDAFVDAFARDPNMQATFEAWRDELIARLRARG